ncbi:MAG TPA: hypothetical protein VIK53_12030 [Verrucomicrobiae bacterium]
MSEENPNKNLEWGRDPLSEAIDNQIATMPDRPKVVLALIKNGKEFDGQYERVFGSLTSNYLSTLPLLVFNLPIRIVFIGFDEADAALSLAITKLNSEIWDEGAIYVDGKVIALLKRPIIKEPLSKVYTGEEN